MEQINGLKKKNNILDFCYKSKSLLMRTKKKTPTCPGIQTHPCAGPAHGHTQKCLVELRGGSWHLLPLNNRASVPGKPDKDHGEERSLTLTVSTMSHKHPPTTTTSPFLPPSLPPPLTPTLIYTAGPLHTCEHMLRRTHSHTGKGKKHHAPITAQKRREGGEEEEEGGSWFRGNEGQLLSLEP